MKFLIQHTYAIKKPFYLIPNFLNHFWGKKKFNELFRFGVGEQEEKLFENNGFDGTEITGIITGVFKENWNFNKERIEKLKKFKYPIEVFHACTPHSLKEKRNKDDWNLNLAKDDDYTRLGISASIYLAKELIRDNPIVNFHLGKYPIENKNFAEEAVIKNLKYAAELAKTEGVVVTVETDYEKFNDEGVFGSNAKELKKILKKVGSSYIGICYDWGHINVQARREFEKRNLTKEDLENFKYHKDFIKTLGEKIYYAHIHYNKAHILSHESEGRHPLSKGNMDYHMPPNKVDDFSKKDYEETLKLLKNKTSIIKCGKIMLELTRDVMFGFIPFNKYGANINDARESLEFVKEILVSRF